MHAGRCFFARLCGVSLVFRPFGLVCSCFPSCFARLVTVYTLNVCTYQQRPFSGAFWARTQKLGIETSKHKIKYILHHGYRTCAPGDEKFRFSSSWSLFDRAAAIRGAQIIVARGWRKLSSGVAPAKYRRWWGAPQVAVRRRRRVATAGTWRRIAAHRRALCCGNMICRVPAARAAHRRGWGGSQT